MKKVILLTAVLILGNASLYAMDVQIKREFTVTQLAIDTQNAQMEENSSMDDNETLPGETKPEGGEAEK